MSEFEEQQQESRFAGLGAVTVDQSEIDLEALGLRMPTRITFSHVAAQRAPSPALSWDFFQGSLLAVGAIYGDGRSAVFGSAVMIAPGLAITATHVVDQDLEQYANKKMIPFCVAPRTGGLDIWSVSWMTKRRSPEDDTCYLSLSLASKPAAGWRLTTMSLTTREPRVGERVYACGFRFDEPPFQGVPALAGSAVTAAGGLLVAAGEVTDVYPEKRHSVLMPYPTIAVQCGSRGAMSGGALLDGKGRVLGIVSRGMETEDQEGPTYAAWLIPGLDRKVNLPWPPGMFAGETHIMDIDSSLLHIVGRDKFVRDNNDAWQRTAWHDE